jgi:hypothetical protein
MAYRVKVKHRGERGHRIINDRHGKQYDLTPGSEETLELSDAEAQFYVDRSIGKDDVEVVGEPEHFDEVAEDKARAEKIKGVDVLAEQRAAREKADAEAQARAEAEAAEAEAKARADAEAAEAAKGGKGNKSR